MLIHPFYVHGWCTLIIWWLNEWRAFLSRTLINNGYKCNIYLIPQKNKAYFMLILFLLVKIQRKFICVLIILTYYLSVWMILYMDIYIILNNTLLLPLFSSIECNIQSFYLGQKTDKMGEWFKKRDSVQTFNKEDYIGAASLVTWIFCKFDLS